MIVLFLFRSRKLLIYNDPDGNFYRMPVRKRHDTGHMAVGPAYPGSVTKWVISGTISPAAGGQRNRLSLVKSGGSYQQRDDFLHPGRIIPTQTLFFV